MAAVRVCARDVPSEAATAGRRLSGCCAAASDPWGAPAHTAASQCLQPSRWGMGHCEWAGVKGARVKRPL
eukprot:scaffold2428_cov80-Isochrysis_galbana.AAC.5